MRILITGGSGFLGQALTRALLERGDEVIILSRQSTKNASRKLASHWVPNLHDIDEPIEAVINLSGENLFARPWTSARKKVLQESRIGVTRRLMQWLHDSEQAPRVLLSGSAIGFYGDQGDTDLHEESPQGRDWAAQLVADWEAAAADFKGRLVYLRTGLVLGDGGLLTPLKPVFRMGLGGSLGDGRFWYSWIHLEDWVQGALHLLDNPRLEGPFNLTAPQPVRYGEFAHALGTALHRPVWLSPPAWLLKSMLGEQAALLLSSTKALPQRLQNDHMRWRYATVEEALQEIFSSPVKTP